MKLEYRPENAPNEKEKEENIENPLEQGLSVSEQMLKQAEKMKDKPLKDKLAYFWEYYKMPFIGVIVGIIIVFSIIKAMVTAKDNCFVAMLVNSANIDTIKMSESFGEYAGLDLKKYDCYIDANDPENLLNSNASEYGAATRFTALLSAADLDCVVYDSVVFNNKAVNDVFFDLRTVLSDEDVKRFEKDFYYVDRDTQKKVSEDLSFEGAYNSTRGTVEEQKEDLEKHMDPSSMVDPIPVGIVIINSPMVKKIDSYFELFPVFAIPQNTQRLDTAIAFLHYINDDSVDFTAMRQY
ncbi:MAG: hypothetical protein K5888_08465 [Lachnospiraceae bacterium]|nr:hypothetical protein [Lachnospiraceae bacterium]